jgi:hypothetical protein
MGKTIITKEEDKVCMEEDVLELFHADKHNEVIVSLKPILESGNFNLKHHFIFAQSLYFIKDYTTALASFEYVIRELSHHTPTEFFQMARDTQQRLHPNKPEIFWQGCSDDVSKKFQRSFFFLTQRNLPEALLYFHEGSSIIFKNIKEKEIWDNSFDVIARAFLGMELGHIDYEPKFCKKIIASGKGWSGSGAIFDYFSEFENVVAIPVETQYIESNKGILNLLQKAGNKDEFSFALLEFFFHCMLGYSEYQDAESFKIFNGPRSLYESELSEVYALNAFEISKLIAITLITPSENLQNEIKFLCNQIVNRLAVLNFAEQAEYVLLDNVIHVSNIEVVNIIEDVSIFCVLRDPRSNYASLNRNQGALNKSCEEYIEFEKRTFPELLQKLDTCISQNENNFKRKVFKVQFEEFVISENYRINLAHQIGLNTNLHKKHSRFKPWESMKNVLLHESYPKQREIEEIKNSLREYCFEPCLETQKND